MHFQARVQRFLNKGVLSSAGYGYLDFEKRILFGENGLNMRAVIQRVLEARVSVGDAVTGRIGKGILILLGVARDDTNEDADYLAKKLINLRIFEDDHEKMNLSLLESGGEALVVSQFTLMGTCKKGRRPSFTNAAPPENANRLYEYFTAKVREAGIKTATGTFQAHMKIFLINDGPVTFVVESI